MLFEKQRVICGTVGMSFRSFSIPIYVYALPVFCQRNAYKKPYVDGLHILCGVFEASSSNTFSFYTIAFGFA